MDFQLLSLTTHWVESLLPGDGIVGGVLVSQVRVSPEPQQQLQQSDRHKTGQTLAERHDRQNKTRYIDR